MIQINTLSSSSDRFKSLSLSPLLSSARRHYACMIPMARIHDLDDFDKSAPGSATGRFNEVAEIV